MNRPFLIAAAVVVTLAGCNAKAPTEVPPSAPGVDAQATPATPATEAAPPPEVSPAPSPRAMTAAPSYSYAGPAPQMAGNEPPPPIYADYSPPLSQPAPIAVPWAPPPMLVEVPPPPPYPDARWTGGYWVWHERWAWAPGRWARPPRPEYHWVPPYYEHRRDRVVFVDGFWSPPGVSFVPPARDLAIALAVVGVAVGVALERAPVGPEGVFVPPPPGSRRGLIVPAPIGTAPAVVTGAPPIVAPGMRVTTNVTNITNNRTTIVNNNITQVTIEAPSNSTASHQAVNVSVPAQAHLAAALPPVEHVRPVGAAHAQAQNPVVASPSPAAPPALAELPVRGQNVAPPLPEARRPDDERKRTEPIDRSRASTQSVRPAPAAAPVPPVPPKPAEHLAPPPAPAARADARAPERPAPAARPAPPPARPAEAAKAEPAPHADPHPPQAHPPAAEKTKAEKSKPEEGSKKNAEPQDDVAKKKEAKAEPPRQ